MRLSASPNALPFSKGFLVTGNYVVGGVDLTPQANPAVNGYSTGTIPISGAPAGGANLVAAYLYFEAVHPSNLSPPTQIQSDRHQVPRSGDQSGGHQGRHETAFGAAARHVGDQRARALSQYRCSARTCSRCMPKQFDLQGKWTGKYIVNSAELPANAQHTVTLREKTGNSAIQSAGATLLLVYRVLDPTEPLRKIVVYDGLYTAYANGVSSTHC